MFKDRKEMLNKTLEIDLNGPEGNAYVLLGYAKNFCKQLDLDWEVCERQMTESDYENLLHVFDTYFGEYVILYR